jgi:hypothetical protein
MGGGESALRLRVVGAGLVECLESDFYTALNPTIYCDCGRSSHDLIMQLISIHFDCDQSLVTFQLLGY